MYKLILGLLVGVACSVPVFAEGVHLFKIERSKNANIVQYDANVVDGKIDPEEPIGYYWVLNASKGEKEDISAFQKKAYGFKAKYNEANKNVDFTLTAVKDRPMKIALHGGAPKAEITINEKPAFLQTVYVNSTDGFAGIPKVHYYILTGTDVKTGAKLTEQIDVK